ncbi:MAG: S8 family serine peptidase, partial [Acidobacteriota bacterium]|nr:S8 family serine peptidase [Acidobacteriota bacterium]
MERLKVVLAVVAATLFAVACGGSSSSNGTPAPATSKYTVGGTITGLEGTLTLRNNGGDDLAVSANGAFTFGTPLANRSTYNVTLAAKPTGQSCYVLGGSGTVRAANVTSVRVVCGVGGISLSGKIAVPAGVLIDSDVNDLKEKYASNDTLALAQPLPNPIAVGGYVNKALSGALGRSFISGDENDYFQVQLKAGDTIALATGEPNTGRNDLDLFLRDGSGNLIDYSVGTGVYEILTAPADGIYFAHVYAYSGASNYILTIGTDTIFGAEATAGILSSQQESVPDQIVVRFKTPTQDSQTGQAATITATATAQTALAQMADMGIQAVSGAPDREMLLTVVATDTTVEAKQATGTFKKLYGQESTKALSSDKARLLDTFGAIKELRQREDIASAEPNYIRHSYGTTPGDPYYVRQWHYPLIKLPEAWDHTTGSDDVIVAVIDTGVLLRHPDLQGRLTSTGYDFIKDTASSGDGNGIDADPDDPGDKLFGSTSSFHGTHCAGTIAAKTDNNSGVAGVTWRTKIMPIRVLGVGGTGTSYDIRQGIRYAAGLSNDSGTTPARPADILSMSFGSSGHDSLDQALFNEVRGKGIIAIAAAGNESTSRLSYPASYDGVISVSAVNISGTRASYSNYGTRIDLAAPGGDSGDLNGDGYPDGVWSTSGDDSSGSIVFSYRAMSGTSMAAPHVAGVVALMKAVYPALSPAELDTLIAAGEITSDIGAPGRDDYYGYGLINAFKAVVAASDAAGGMSITGLDANPKTVNFGVFGTSATVTISKIGNGVLSVTKVSVDGDAGWLTVTPASVDSDGFGGYRFEVDRDALPQEGTYTAVAVFTASSGDSIAIGVTLQVRTTETAYDAGRHYVLLVRVDGENPETVNMVEATASDGYYSYSFANVVPGTYRIIAGSDRDNDGYLGDEGEA